LRQHSLLTPDLHGALRVALETAPADPRKLFSCRYFPAIAFLAIAFLAVAPMFASVPIPKFANPCGEL
jgi:hypothetical protein